MNLESFSRDCVTGEVVNPAVFFFVFFFIKVLNKRIK